MKKIILAALTAAFVLPSAAYADAGSSYITEFITAIDSHSVLFNQSGSRSNTPACGQEIALRWAIDTSTPFGQSQLAVLLSAYALHKPIALTGTITCSVHGDTETVRYINIIDN